MAESQSTEWKRSWKDEYLKWVCGFANAKGGKIFVGKDDDGKIVNLENSKRLLEEIPNKIKSLIGLTVDVMLHQTDEGDYLEIDVHPQSMPVSYRGRYYYRTGSTKVELTGASLNEFLLKKSGSTWDASIENRAKLKDIDPQAIELFLSDAKTANRLPNAASLSTSELLDKLRLRTNDQLTCAALILFGRDPGRFYPGLSVRIGRFGSSSTDLRFQEVVEGNLIYCLKQTLSLLDSKFLIKPVRFEGIQRIEEDLYPLPALREALLNALVHRRYQSGVHVQIRVYDNQLVIWNDGPLPEELPVSALLQQHSSRPRNPLIADTCFKAGYIDSWGRGIEKITEACIESNLPPPHFEDVDGGLRVTLTSQVSEHEKPSSGEVTGEVTGEVAGEVIKLLSVMTGSLKRTEIQSLLGLKHEDHFRETYLKPALEKGYIEMTIPDKPTSRLQKYRLTEKGRALLA